jgi:peptide/nickel transport system ATP-binding protein/oligopeptide transport system ATP-binding protein
VTVLALDALSLRLVRDGESARVVDEVSWALGRSRALGIVGESGCGKSLQALAIMRLLPRPSVHYESGRVLLDGKDITTIDSESMRRIRGGRIAMVFQEPMTSLNPVFSVGEQIAEVLREHAGLGRKQAALRAIELLEEVGLDRPADRARQIPQELSGGMRQRVMIAMALAGDPDVLLADEPTTALDVTVQAQILDLLDRLRRDRGMAVVLITHDLALVSGRTDEVAVMYAGRIVEHAPTPRLFAAPSHPYTLGLLACRPRLGGGAKTLPTIGGQVTDPADRPAGCAFHPRCPFAAERCRAEVPSLRDDGHAHQVACFESERVREAGGWPDV